MSAYVVDPAHIDVLLTIAINGPYDRTDRQWTPPYTCELLGEHGPLTPERANRAGAALLEENIASVAHRYDEPPDSPNLPGPIPVPDPARYEWTNLGRNFTIAEGAKALGCLEYQSCEHSGWTSSGAFFFCQRLRHSLLCAITGYDGAPWNWTVEELDRRGMLGSVAT